MLSLWRCPFRKGCPGHIPGQPSETTGDITEVGEKRGDGELTKNFNEMLANPGIRPITSTSQGHLQDTGVNEMAICGKTMRRSIRRRMQRPRQLYFHHPHPGALLLSSPSGYHLRPIRSFEGIREIAGKTIKAGLPETGR